MADTSTAAVDLSSNELELTYSANRDHSYRKKHGQFFTPYSVACFMSQWVARVPATNPNILDPCAGLGVFERALFSTDPVFAAQARFTLWEKDEGLANDLSDVCDRLAISHSVISKDFVNEHDWSATYDGIIANPPYYKHHFVENKKDVLKAISSNVGAEFSVQTNIYCWFLIKALSLLKPCGRLAFIIPTEFLNSNYGRDVKSYLIKTGFLRHIISVCYKSKTFDDAITTACVLLAEKGVRPSSRIRFYYAESHEQLGDLSHFLADTAYIEYKPSDLNVEHKWRSYFPGNTQADRENANLVPLSTYGRFSRGIATGANEFFAISPSTAEKHGLPQECLIPCISKARQAPGKVFTKEQYGALLQADKPVLLFDGNAIRNDAVKNYIRLGEDSGFQQRYLTRARKPWYTLEKRSTGKIWVGVFGRAGIRFIWNESDSISLTCFHVFQANNEGSKYLPLLFLYLNSSVGQKFLELEKREYGDGLEKYEPNDINQVLAPDLGLLVADDLRQLADLQIAYLAVEEGSAEEQAISEKANAIFDCLIQANRE